MNKHQNSTLFNSIKQLIEEARLQVVRNVNTQMVVMYFEIGRRIVQEEQKGKSKAECRADSQTIK